MNKDPVRSIRTTTVVRHEMHGPPGEGIDRKHWTLLFNTFLRDFNRVKEREPEYDDDWWIEPTDDGIAICFIDEKRTTQ